MTKHLIKEYLMLELVNNAILDEFTETDSQKQVYDVLNRRLAELEQKPQINN